MPNLDQYRNESEGIQGPLLEIPLKNDFQKFFNNDG